MRREEYKLELRFNGRVISRLIIDQPYRLVFLIPKGEDFLGIINAFRVRRKIK